MSSRKRPLSEISQPHAATSRYAPSTPHAIRALQQRSGANSRSARKVRHDGPDVVRPDSIRGILRQFAKISAPITKKRVVTPSTVLGDKENRRPNELDGDEDDSVLLKRPRLTFTIEDEVEEDDSELPMAPTPTVLPDDDDNDYDQPTITFQNLAKIRDGSGREYSYRRRSRISSAMSDSVLEVEQDDPEEEDFTIATERGRRALSEEATGRLSRYSFGSIRMSDFGSELEIRRESNQQKTATGFEFDDYIPPAAADDLLSDDEVNNTRDAQNLPHIEVEDDTVQMSRLDDETFRLESPATQDEINKTDTQRALARGNDVVRARSTPTRDNVERIDRGNGTDAQETEKSVRRQTLLEIATTKASVSRRKRVKLTKHGIAVPSLPRSLIKRIVLTSYEEQGKRKPKLGRDHMEALEQASEWFFEQAGEDLAAYSSHGRRKKRITSDDVLLLMSRQRLMREEGELQQLAKTWLPRDMLQELDLPDVV